MSTGKADFLKNQIVPLIKKLKGDEKGKWGKMNAQQMTEHVADFFKVSVGKKTFPLLTPPEHLEAYKEFLWSDKEFRENTKAPVLPDEPLALRNGTMLLATGELETDIINFFQYFIQEPSKTTLHPAFGNLNFNEWVQLHHKHVTHHLKQFALM